MFPILPLVYLNWQNTDFHANLFWIFDYSSQNDKLNTLAFFPFLFLDKSERGYLHILPPLYLNFWNDSDGTYYRHILPFYFSFGDKNGNTIFGPLFYHDESKSGSTNWAGLFHWKRDAVGAIPKFWFVPFYFSNEEISVGEKKSSGYRHIFPPFYLSLWDDSDKSFYRHIFPAFFSFGDRDQQTYFGPFYFHKDEEKRSSTLIGNIYWQKEKASGLSAIWIMPVYFSGESVSPGGLSTTGYRWILPLYYSAWDDFSGSKYLHLFPFYFSYSVKNEETFFGPFYYHNRSGKSGSTLIGNVYWSENSGTGESYFQIFPFYFSSKSDLSVTRNILFFANWKSRDPDGLESMQFFPFLFYEKNSYLHVFPFYWSATLSDNSFFSVSPVHYIRRTVKRDTTWVANYYSSEDRPGKEKFLTFFPFYFEWDTPESVGNLTIPLHLKYTDENRDVDLYFPGLSIAKTRGTLGADFSIGKKNSRYYLDFEVSWWYNLFSIATRTTFDIPVPWSREAKAATAASLVASGVAAPGQSKDDSTDAGKNPKLVKNKTVSRETSENFWGWNFLFGIAAF
ncbi:MAG: hypothetical protein K8R21_00675, partial [Leptospira sp.]|nr:hypothetical protein [Leptospira sp.]